MVPRRFFFSFFLSSALKRSWQAQSHLDHMMFIVVNVRCSLETPAREPKTALNGKTIKDNSKPIEKGKSFFQPWIFFSTLDVFFPTLGFYGVTRASLFFFLECILSQLWVIHQCWCV